MYPIENLFVHFQSPERAFHYIQSGAIKGTVDGRESCMVVYRNNDGAYSYEMILKTEDGYQLPGNFKTKRVSQKLDRQAALDVYNVRGTQDYYVSGFVNQKDIGSDIAVFNPANEKVDTNVVRIENVDFLCFWLPGFSDGYYLKVNGEKIALSP